MFSAAGIASMVSTIAGEFESVVGGVAGMLGAQPELQKQVQEGIDGLHTTAAALAAAENSDQSQSLVNRIATDANAVLAPLAALPLPPQGAIVLRIAQVLIPTVMGVASIIWPAQPAPAISPAPVTVPGA